MVFNNSSFSTRQQQGLFNRHGDEVDLFPARKCSCSTALDANRANANCRACKGLGYVYRTSKRIVGLVTGISNQKMLLESTIVQPGDLVFSQRLQEPTPMSDFDMIRLTWDGVPYEGDLLTRGTGPTDLLVYDATDLVEVLQMDPLTGTITTYTAGTDFTFVSRTDRITWLTGAMPATGSTYSVKYNAVIDWIAFTSPAQRYERGTPLGNRVFLRRKDILLAKAA